MRSARMRLLIIATMAISPLVGQAAASASDRSPLRFGNPLQFCGFVNVAYYNYHTDSGALISGKEYNVSVFGMSCPAARTYAISLSHAEPKTYIATYGLDLLYNASGTKFAHWPPHFICAGNSYTLDRHHPPTISGACWRGGTDPFSSKNTGYLEFAASSR